ncbi:helix-turn-helix domain-containing protein [Streptomyces sp. NPDC059373]
MDNDGPDHRPTGSADRAEDLTRFGGRLRTARRSAGLTIEDVAKRTGLSKGFVSQLERDNTQVSVANLVRICAVVGVDVGSLFRPPGHALVTRENRTEINFGGHGVRDFLLTPPNRRGFQLIEAELEPAATSGDEPYALDVEQETVHVLEGSLTVQIEDETFPLQAGDTLTFGGRTRHTWRNASPRVKARVIWVLAPGV